MKGIITTDGISSNGIIYDIPSRNIGKVLVDSKNFNGKGLFQAQSLFPLIGLTVEFSVNNLGGAYNVKVLNVKA